MSPSSHLAIIGVPSSAGAYAPGQERAPAALRAVGLLDCLQAHGLPVRDHGDAAAFRWRLDRENPRAMNAGMVAQVARAAAKRIAEALAGDGAALVLGG